MRDLLRTSLTQELNIAESKVDYIVSHFKEKAVKKNQILVEGERVCKFLYFINSGCMRVFIIKDDGQEWTRHIAFEGEFITIIPSFVRQEVTKASLQSIEDTELLCITHENFQKLLEEIPEWDKYYRILLEEAYINSIKRIEDSLSMDTRGMYNSCLINTPQLIQRLSNKMLASYLGVSQETLSRVKSGP